MFTSRLPHAFFALIIALSLSLVEPVDISLAIDGVGRVTVPGSAEPVDVILQFAREATRRGHVLMKNHEYLTRMLDFFCLRRACARTLPKSIKLQVENRQLVIEPWEEPADQLENFVSQLSGRNREVANNLASLLPQICQKTPCFRTEHDWPKSLDAESTTIQVDWKRLSVGRIRRHPGRFNHSMESHPAAAEIGDACAMPFFLDGADSTTGCLLNASIVFGFARLGGYSGEILRRHIIHGLRDAGVMPMPPKTQLPLSFLRTVHKELAVWLVHHSVVSTLRSAESDERQSRMASSPVGQTLIVGDDHLTYEYLLGKLKFRVVRLQSRNITSQSFVPVRIDTLPINFSFHWESFWTTGVTSIDKSIRTYCTNVAFNSLSVQNDAGGINELGGALLDELLNEGDAHYRGLNWDRLAIVTEKAGFLAENFMNSCMEDVGEKVNRGLWDLGQAREHREIVNECGHEGSLLRSIPISRDLRSIIPSAVMALRLDSGRVQRISDEGWHGPDPNYAFFYDGERPDVVASDLCELIGPQKVVTGLDLNCTFAKKHTCCIEQIATRFKSYKSSTRDSYGIDSHAENAHRKRIRQFQPREYLHVCKSDTDIHSLALGGQIPNLMANPTAALIPGTRRFCARMFDITEDQLDCEKKVLGSTVHLLAGQINTNPRIMNFHGFFLGQEIHGSGRCQFRESHSIKSTVCKSDQHWEIVVSRCKESVLWLAQFIRGLPACVKKVCIQLYEKCDNDNRVLLEKLRIALDLTDSTNLSERVVSIKSKVLPNIGFEAHTYVYHILGQLKKQTKTDVELKDSGSNAFSADHTFFLQGNPMDHGQRRDVFFTKAYTLPFHPETRDYASLSGIYIIAPVNPLFCRVHDFLFRSAGVAETNRAECSGTLGFYGFSSFFASRDETEDQVSNLGNQ